MGSKKIASSRTLSPKSLSPKSLSPRLKAGTLAPEVHSRRRIAADPEPRRQPVPPPAELASVPKSAALCYSQPCLEVKYNLPYYLRKCDLMRHLREQHDLWWEQYNRLYERNNYTYPTNRTGSGWDYTNAAKELLTRCKLLDSTFTQVLKLDLTHVDGFGAYCRLLFLELHRLKPAFPDAPCSQAVFDAIVQQTVEFVIAQAPPGLPPGAVPSFESLAPRGT